MDINERIQQSIDQRMAGSRLRSRSLIVTLFGDYVSVFSQSIQLSIIIRLLGPFELKESLIRTTVNRLLKSGWISYTKSGRKSLYSITHEGRHRFELFSKRVYRPRPTNFDDDWAVLLVDDLEHRLLQKLRRQLLWLGYSPISPRSFVHPGSNVVEAIEVIDNLGLQDKVIIGNFNPVNDRSRRLVLDQARGKLPLDAVNSSYAAFIDKYDNVRQLGDELRELRPDLCFRLRLLLIHDYRRILLRDPDLPQGHLPKNWHGIEAHELLLEIYARINEPSTEYFAQAIQFDSSHLPEAIEQSVSRFRIGAAV